MTAFNSIFDMIKTYIPMHIHTHTYTHRGKDALHKSERLAVVGQAVEAKECGAKESSPFSPLSHIAIRIGALYDVHTLTARKRE